MDFALRSCGLRGHATFAPDEAELRDRLRVRTPEGDAWRCLRCECFVVGEPAGRGPADQAPQVPHGRTLRDRFIMRLLAVERAVRALVLAALGVGVLRVRGEKDALHTAFENELPMIRPLAEQLGWNADSSKLVHLIDRTLTESTHALLLVASALLAYALIELIEAVGLWLGHRWGEYFAVIATSVFLPLEIYELTEKITALRIGVLVVNIAAVLWLLWSKRLFGLNGGATAYHADHEQESLLAVQHASK
jgi:uncharacterized membrane protein (DUF2068 family)